MNRSIALIPVLSALITVHNSSAHASGVTTAEPTAIVARTPNTAAAAKWAGLIARTERALGVYAAACAAGEAQSLDRVVTDDLRVEYTLRDPGTFVGMDASSLQTTCAALTGLTSRTSDLWIFPTNAGVVFIQYDAPSAAGEPARRRLALVEMRGDRMSRIVNFASSTPTLMAAEAQNMADTLAGGQ
jgi:hypothetical protein